MKKTMSILMTLLFVHYSYAQTTVAPTAPIAPTAPDYASCNGAAASSQRLSCQQALDQQYQLQLSQYNSAYKQYQAQIQSQVSATPALQAARAAEAVNGKGKDAYKTTQTVTMVLSMVAAAAAMACGPSPCKPVFTKIAIAMAAISMLAGTQSGKHKDAQLSACNTANQLTTTPSNCGPTATPYNPSTFPAFAQDGTSTTTTPSNIVDSNGNCTASQEVCGQIASSLPPGTSLRDYQKGLSAFASGKAPFKVNADGTITRTSDGKKLDPAIFGTKEGLISQGFSPSEAQSLLSSVNKGKNGLDDATAKSASGTGQVADAGLFEDAAGLGRNGAAGGIGFGVNGEANANGLDGDKNRTIASASEGLVRDFNGENIGVQGDDIFKMMKRRYLLKDKQDSFLSTPAAPAP